MIYAKSHGSSLCYLPLKKKKKKFMLSKTFFFFNSHKGQNRIPKKDLPLLKGTQ